MERIKKLVLCLLAVSVFFTFCSDDDDDQDDRKTGGLRKSVDFHVISDPHYYDPDLGVSGSAFEDYVMKDRKLIAESEAIMEKAVEMIKQSKPEFLLVPGDLTKDGERSSHEKYAAYLKEIEASGTDVFVVPGNHDVNNPHAFSYSGDNTVKVDHVGPEEFKDIYKDFGYDEAVEQDPNSLSYLVKYRDDVWILGTDPCQYDQNLELNYPVTGGEYKAETLSWVLEKIKEAKEAKVLLLAMAHHGIMPHWTMQKQLFSEYVIEEWEVVSSQMAREGLRLIFTGHFHAQDAVMKDFGDGDFLFDIETGSLVTSPCPLRKIVIGTDMEMKVESEFVESIDYDLGGANFQVYSLDYLKEGMDILIRSVVSRPPYDVQGEDLEMISPVLTAAMVAHYAGDEAADDISLQAINLLLGDSDPIKQMVGLALQSIWNDPAPADNDFQIDLNTGAIIQ